MFERIRKDQIVVQFAGEQTGTEPLTWGQKAILEDMRDSGSQFSMPSLIELPEGTTVEGVAALLSDLLRRHSALRTRLVTDDAGRPCQQVAGSGQIDLDILTIPDDADRADAEQCGYELVDTWPLKRFDFYQDWPLRTAVITHRGACLYLVWVLSHLVADGGAHILIYRDFQDDLAGRPVTPLATQILDMARSEQTPRLQQLSSRTMRYWESQLRDIPAQTFSVPGGPREPAEPEYWQVRFKSPATHLAMLAISKRTGTDAAGVTLALIATAIGRATGVHPLTVKVMVSNRFRPGLADVIAPISQSTVITVDAADASIDEVVARTRGASLTAGMRAYYNPDELTEVMARLDAERGYPAKITCRVNDQRAMVMRAADLAGLPDITLEQVTQRLAESTLTWLGPRDHVYGQANILVENRPDVVSLHMMWDLECLSKEQVEALLRGVEDAAIEAAFDPAARTKVYADLSCQTSPIE
jgi:hypothetical protein